MFLFYAIDIVSDIITLSHDEHMHCTKVLRKKIGDMIYATDGNGHIFHCSITSIQKNSTICKIAKTEYKEAPKHKVAIAITPTKNTSRIEWFAEKAVEIGISAIYFVHTQRTEKKEINMQRIEKILLSAMKQSLNVHLPTAMYYKSLKDFAYDIPNIYDQKFIAHCDVPTESLQSQMDKNQSAILMIGPEGDFTPDEVNLMKGHSFLSVSLGDARLRTETAGLLGLMMMRY